MKTLRTLLAHISVSLLNQESPDFPTVWQFQGDPMWVETRAPDIFHRGKQASPRIPGALGGSSKNLRPPGKLFLPDWLSLTCNPLSQLRTVLASAVPMTPDRHLAGAQTAATVAPASRWEEVKLPGLQTLPWLQSAQQWLPRDLQVIKEQNTEELLSQVLGSLILHVPQQGVGTCLAQSG